jgi:hypothetical protein
LLFAEVELHNVLKIIFVIPIIGGRIPFDRLRAGLRQAQNRFESRLKSGGISLTLNLRPTDS